MKSQLSFSQRNQLLKELRNKEQEEFENSLPMSREQFRLLFSFLGKELQKRDCAEDLRITEAFLIQHQIQNKEEVLEWLSESGASCDSEVLEIVEEQFD